MLDPMRPSGGFLVSGCDSKVFVHLKLKLQDTIAPAPKMSAPAAKWA